MKQKLQNKQEQKTEVVGEAGTRNPVAERHSDFVQTEHGFYSLRVDGNRDYVVNELRAMLELLLTYN